MGSCVDDYDGNHSLPSAFALGLDSTDLARGVFGDGVVLGVGNEQGLDRLVVCPGSPDFFALEVACAGYLPLLWDGRTGESLATLQGHTVVVRALAWTADGTRLATASDDGTARLWDGRTGESLATLQGHTAEVRALAWADETRLATTSRDGTVRLWDGRTGKSLATLQGHTGWVNALAWTADGTLLATASKDGTARLWLASPQGWLQSGCDILERSTTAIDLDPETIEICAKVRETSEPLGR